MIVVMMMVMIVVMMVVIVVMMVVFVAMIVVIVMMITMTVTIFIMGMMHWRIIGRLMSAFGVVSVGIPSLVFHHW